MRILRWHPGDAVKHLREGVSRRVAELRSPFSLGWTGRGEERVLRLPLDAYTTAEEIVVRAAVPGLGPDDVEVALVGNTLTIEGRFPDLPARVDALFQEIVTGRFRREVRLNVPVRADQVEARFSKGILTVILLKGAEARSKAVEVDAIGTSNSPIP